MSLYYSTLNRLFKESDGQPKWAHLPMLRDIFAVEYLLAGTEAAQTQIPKELLEVSWPQVRSVAKTQGVQKGTTSVEEVLREGQ